MQGAYFGAVGTCPEDAFDGAGATSVGVLWKLTQSPQHMRLEVALDNAKKCLLVNRH